MVEIFGEKMYAIIIRIEIVHMEEKRRLSVAYLNVHYLINGWISRIKNVRNVNRLARKRGRRVRIISQNGFIDVPYEMTAFHMAGGTIKMNMVGDPGKGTIIAQYSTQEKAEKAMLLLYKIYIKAPLENEAKEMGEFVYGTYKGVGNWRTRYDKW